MMAYKPSLVQFKNNTTTFNNNNNNNTLSSLSDLVVNLCKRLGHATAPQSQHCVFEIYIADRKVITCI